MSEKECSSSDFGLEFAINRAQYARPGGQTVAMNSLDGDVDPEAVKQVAPLDGCAISLVDFSISLTSAEKEKVIIHPLSTNISSGSLFAILGGSGSGKTTLLNVLASRYDNRHFIVHGQVHFSSGGRHVGYVTQNDFLLPFLTVHETLLFTAKLKLAGEASTTALVALVDQVVLDLGLRECAQTRIGDDANAAGLRGISGGEKRRVSVGVQILTNPQVLCADEPTSGLDSFTAVTVVECLRRLSEQRGMTVVCSIHQPRADIFFLFDDVLLLTKGGHAIYCGPTKALVSYFDRLGYACPASANPADFFVDLSSVDIYADGREQRLQCMRRLRHLVSAFQATQTKTAVAAADYAIPSPPTAVLNRTPWTLQVWVLLQRFTLNTLRDRSSLLGGIVQATVLGLVLMGIFFSLDESYAAVRSRTGLLYISVSLESYIMMIILVHKYCSEVKVLDRELQDELYHPTAYFIAHFLSSAPPLLILPMTIFSLPAYFGTKLRLAADDGTAGGDDETGNYFGVFLAVMLTLVLCINGMSWTSVSLSRQFSIASLISNMSFTFLSLSCGFLVNLDEMPVYTRWLKHITFLSYGYRILMQNEFQGRIFRDCDANGNCITFAGDDVLPSYGVERNNYRTSWPVLLGIALLYHVLPMIFLTWLRFPPIAAATEQPAKSGDGNDDDEDDDELALLARWENDAADVSPDADLPAICDTDPATDPAAKDLTTVPVPTTGAKPATRDAAGDGSSTPHPALWNIDVQDVNLFATLPRGARKQLLYGINVRITAGRLVALLGGSGSGKSTLLNLVANRIPHAALRESDTAVDAAGDNDTTPTAAAPSVGLTRGLSRSYSAVATAAQTPRASRGVGGKYIGTGRVLFGNRVAPPALVRSLVGYVQQHDFHLPSLTVAETLLFHAQLRLDADRAAVASAQVYAARVQSALQLMGLTRCRHVRVGDAEAKGISGGEKRRLSVAVQLLSDPSICLLDEPTTGLDAFTARHVVWTLKRLATGAGAVDGAVDAAMQRPRTVALSIHQPRYDVFALFDDVVLLSRGHVLWSGGAAELLRHLSRLGLPCPPLTNPADFALDVSSIDTRTVEAESASRARWKLLVAAFANRSASVSNEDVATVEKIDVNINVTVDAADVAPAAALKSGATQPVEAATFAADIDQNTSSVASNEKPFWVAYPLVLGRAWRNLRRQPELLTVRLSQTLFFALILCAYYAPTQHSQRSIQNRVGNLYEFTALTFVGMLNCIAIFPAERDVFYREYFDGCYSAWTFAAAYLSLAAPLSAVAAIAFAVLMACAVGLQPTAVAVAQFSYIAWTFLISGEALGVLFCTLFDEIGFSVNVVSVVISFFGVMAGFISPTMPRGLVMLSYASPMRWGAYLLMHIAFGGEHFDCDGTAVQCLTTGEEVLELYNFGSRDNYKHGRFGGRFFYGMTAVVTASFIIVAVASLRLRALRLSH